MHVAGLFPAAESWRFVLYIAANVGATGFLTGAAFSAFLRAAYIDRPLLDINLPRVSLSAAAIAALCAPLVGLVARASIGAPIVLGDLLAASPFATILGGLSGGGLVFVAQRATARLVSSATADLEVEQGESVALLKD
jgi:hypothetical protein